MKKQYITLAAVLLGLTAKAQLSINPNQTANYLANKLVATSGTLGVTITNATLTCDSLSNGEFSGTSNLGISDGIVLGTGEVASNSVTSVIGLDGIPSDFASTSPGTAGDTLLTTLIGSPTYDACVLAFDLQPAGSFVEFEYVFGSEEYPEFNCSAFNDVFGFYISGPGFAAPTNIALLPASTTPVSINTVNDGSNASCVSNSAYYVTNTGSSSTLDGFTVPLIATAPVTAGSTYHLKMAIADVSDGIMNSYVMLKANSLKSGNTTPAAVVNHDFSKEISLFPNPVHDQLFVKTSGQDDILFVLNDMQGNTVYRVTFQAAQQNQTIDLSQCLGGYYQYQMINLRTGARQSGHLVKQ